MHSDTLRCMKMIDLLKEPEYRKYFLKSPRFPYKLAHPQPWTVWARKPSKKNPGRFSWARNDFATFKEAFVYSKTNWNGWDDFSICSRIIGFDPPQSLRNAYELNDWCYRCRRPVVMRTFSKHHALNTDIHEYFVDWPICPFCGSSGEHQYTLVPG